VALLSLLSCAAHVHAQAVPELEALGPTVPPPDAPDGDRVADLKIVVLSRQRAAGVVTFGVLLRVESVEGLPWVPLSGATWGSDPPWEEIVAQTKYTWTVRLQRGRAYRVGVGIPNADGTSVYRELKAFRP
jgi:hypothetical protein